MFSRFSFFVLADQERSKGMKPRSEFRSFFVAVAIGWGIMSALAEDAPSAPPALDSQAAAAIPAGAENWAKMMWDFTRNPDVMKDPKVFLPWMSAATEPAFYTALGMQMLDPTYWGFMANSMMDPRAYSAWMPLMSDPNVYMKWMAASADPNFYTAVLTQFSDPGKMMRWLMAPVDPKVWGLVMQSINPAVYLKWMMAPLDQQWLKAMITPMTPNVYIGWLGAMMNPASYGEAWKAFLTTPTQPIAPLIYPAPTATPTGTMFNPFDPNSWTQAFTLPGTTSTPTVAPATTPYGFNPFDPNTWAQILQVPYGTPTAPSAPSVR